MPKISNAVASFSQLPRLGPHVLPPQGGESDSKSVNVFLLSVAAMPFLLLISRPFASWRRRERGRELRKELLMMNFFLSAPVNGYLCPGRKSISGAHWLYSHCTGLGPHQQGLMLKDDASLICITSICRQMIFLPIDHAEVKFYQFLDLPGNWIWA